MIFQFSTQPNPIQNRYYPLVKSTFLWNITMFTGQINRFRMVNFHKQPAKSPEGTPSYNFYVKFSDFPMKKNTSYWAISKHSCLIFVITCCFIQLCAPTQQTNWGPIPYDIPIFHPMNYNPIIHHYSIYNLRQQTVSLPEGNPYESHVYWSLISIKYH